ncbi:MAG: RagB/SusD family nutrient uptake outer membrane protein [Lewinellaceae bacterium]|nr:RagB/SusD family nutrient uptake outer membrane protein [Phaeodactylibacter sp.]MCB9038610.1 RagB/SusD family nutrient uptake outer membrane protein [Lewinellaceae bacterium]
MKRTIHYTLSFLVAFFLAVGCKDIDTLNLNNAGRNDVLATGSDLFKVLDAGYAAWWQGVHGPAPVIALSVAADALTLGMDGFGARRMSAEPRAAYNNRIAENEAYKQIAEGPWYGCLSAAASANDVIAAMKEGISIDKGGPQDESVLAAAHLLRGVSWGYLGLIFDRGLMVDENDAPEATIPFSGYREMIGAAVDELEEAISLAEALGPDFIHTSFNGLTLDAGQFIQLCHSYAARFLAQWPRTEEENLEVSWAAVQAHAEDGLQQDFAPLADGKLWQSYQQYAFAETGKGPFWARVDQRLVAALDRSQPPRYPEVEAQGEAPLANPNAQSNDQRLASDFVFIPFNSFPVEAGEWHFSHYKHNRNQADPDFAGDGFATGPMPAFLAADNQLLLAEALLWQGNMPGAIAALNAGPRVARGGLPPLSAGASEDELLQAIRYERAIELLNTAPMGQWFDRRRLAPRLDFTELDALGGLQYGTPAQLPVPARELQVHKEEPYNFGGEKDPEGVVAVY